MNRFRPFILVAAVVLTAFVSYGLWTLPKAKPADYEGFSAERAVKDIEVISRRHHSVAHPEERAEVREYLVRRLHELGADSVRVFRYDSLTGPQNKHVEYTFDAYDVLAEFAPLKDSDDAAYLMMVAHYDSRYSHPMPKDTVWSYGAADDGYGVGVILETVSQLLKQRSDWHQGVKVLFTDAEEVGMMGMKAIWENDREVFENVGLIINIEARGPYGPALLFEACPGNERVMQLYEDEARYPYTYSLTTVVYGFMPNFTDFTIVKDEIPGLNFSTIADVNHYHTDLDNFGNVNPASIQHYGAQILPVAGKYLTSEEFSGIDSMKAEEDAVNFTIPALGLFNFSRIGYVIFNVVIFLIFLVGFALEGVRGRLKAAKVFRKACLVLISSIAALALGELVAYVCASVSGALFKPFGIVQGIPFDNAAMMASVAVMAVVSVLVYMTFRNKAVRAASGSMRASAAINAARHYAGNALYGTMSLMFVLSLVLLLAIGENLMFFIPLAAAAVAMLLYRLLPARVWLFAAMVLVLLHAFSFLYALSMALTIGALGAVMMIAFIDIMLLIPLADLYTMPERRK